MTDKFELIDKDPHKWVEEAVIYGLERKAFKPYVLSHFIKNNDCFRINLKFEDAHLVISYRKQSGYTSLIGFLFQLRDNMYIAPISPVIFPPALKTSMDPSQSLKEKVYVLIDRAKKYYGYISNFEKHFINPIPPRTNKEFIMDLAFRIFGKKIRLKKIRSFNLWKRKFFNSFPVNTYDIYKGWVFARPYRYNQNN